MADNAARPSLAAVGLAGILGGIAAAMAAPPGATHHPTQRFGTIVHSTATPAPSGLRNVLVTSGHCLASTRFDNGLVVTRKLHGNGELGPQLSSAAVGTAPRAIVRPGNGRRLVVANSGSDDMSVVEVDDDCGLTDRGRVPSGGDDPFHAATGFDDLVAVVHRGSDSLDIFELLENGELVPVDAAPTGAAPHAVAVSPRGLVAVANSESDDLTLFDLGRDGKLREVRRSRPLQGPPKAAPQRAGDDKALSIDATTGRRVLDPDDPPGFVPGALAFSPDDAALFVAARSPQPGVEDRIYGFAVAADGELTLASVTVAGAFATDLVATADRLYLATISIAGKDEIRVYHREGALLRRDTVTTLPSPSPSFKRLEIVPSEGSPDTGVVASEFQSGQLRSILYHR